MDATQIIDYKEETDEIRKGQMWKYLQSNHRGELRNRLRKLKGSLQRSVRSRLSAEIRKNELEEWQYALIFCLDAEGFANRFVREELIKSYNISSIAQIAPLDFFQISYPNFYRDAYKFLLQLGIPPQVLEDSSIDVPYKFSETYPRGKKQEEKIRKLIPSPTDMDDVLGKENIREVYELTNKETKKSLEKFGSGISELIGIRAIFPDLKTGKVCLAKTLEQKRKEILEEELSDQDFEILARIDVYGDKISEGEISQEKVFSHYSEEECSSSLQLLRAYGLIQQKNISTTTQGSELLDAHREYKQELLQSQRKNVSDSLQDDNFARALFLLNKKDISIDLKSIDQSIQISEELEPSVVRRKGSLLKRGIIFKEVVKELGDEIESRKEELKRKIRENLTQDITDEKLPKSLLYIFCIYNLESIRERLSLPSGSTPYSPEASSLENVLSYLPKEEEIGLGKVSSFLFRLGGNPDLKRPEMLYDPADLIDFTDENVRSAFLRLLKKQEEAKQFLQQNPDWGERARYPKGYEFESLDKLIKKQILQLKERNQDFHLFQPRWLKNYSANWVREGLNTPEKEILDTLAHYESMPAESLHGLVTKISEYDFNEEEVREALDNLRYINAVEGEKEISINDFGKEIAQETGIAEKIQESSISYLEGLENPLLKRIVFLVDKFERLEIPRNLEMGELTSAIREMEQLGMISFDPISLEMEKGKLMEELSEEEAYKKIQNDLKTELRNKAREEINKLIKERDPQDPVLRAILMLEELEIRKRLGLEVGGLIEEHYHSLPDSYYGVLEYMFPKEYSEKFLETINRQLIRLSILPNESPETSFKLADLIDYKDNAVEQKLKRIFDPRSYLRSYIQNTSAEISSIREVIQEKELEKELDKKAASVLSYYVIGYSMKEKKIIVPKELENILESEISTEDLISEEEKETLQKEAIAASGEFEVTEKELKELDFGFELLPFTVGPDSAYIKEPVVIFLVGDPEWIELVQGICWLDLQDRFGHSENDFGVSEDSTLEEAISSGPDNPANLKHGLPTESPTQTATRLHIFGSIEAGKLKGKKDELIRQLRELKEECVFKYIVIHSKEKNALDIARSLKENGVETKVLNQREEVGGLDPNDRKKIGTFLKSVLNGPRKIPELKEELKLHYSNSVSRVWDILSSTRFREKERDKIWIQNEQLKPRQLKGQREHTALGILVYQWLTKGLGLPEEDISVELRKKGEEKGIAKRPDFVAGKELAVEVETGKANPPLKSIRDKLVRYKDVAEPPEEIFVVFPFEKVLHYSKSALQELKRTIETIPSLKERGVRLQFYLADMTNKNIYPYPVEKD